MPIFGELPRSLQRNATNLRLGQDVPAMIVRPEKSDGLEPLLLWMHGRTVNKELDPGRYLRLMRRGIATCALDLPGHGERHDEEMHAPSAILDVVAQMVEEIDPILEDLRALGTFDPDRLAIGGMSAGGIVTLVRLCREHPFTCAAVEATTGNRAFGNAMDMFEPVLLNRMNAIDHLDGWREIPFLALHNQFDEWIDVASQRTFINALRARYEHPEIIEFHVYEQETGAPFEHSGFGRFAADAKSRQVEFLARHLRPTT